MTFKNAVDLIENTILSSPDVFVYLSIFIHSYKLSPVILTCVSNHCLELNLCL